MDNLPVQQIALYFLGTRKESYGWVASSQQVLPPLGGVLQLMSPPWGSGRVFISWHLELFGCYPKFPIPHCYTPLFNFLTLCTFPPSPPIPNSSPLFPFPLFSSFQVPPTLYFPWLFCYPSKKDWSIHTLIFLLLELHVVCELYLGYSELLG